VAWENVTAAGSVVVARRFNAAYFLGFFRAG
jgi:hypothetical protein